MIKIFLILSLFSLNVAAQTLNNKDFRQFSSIPTNYLNKIVLAIYKAEGGDKTKYPFGIRSIKTNNPEQICRNTVSNNWLRWQKAGKTNDFITFLGNKYAPPNANNDPSNLNKNWIKNVNFYLKQK